MTVLSVIRSHEDSFLREVETFVCLSVCMYVCVVLVVKKRERVRERENCFQYFNTSASFCLLKFTHKMPDLVAKADVTVIMDYNLNSSCMKHSRADK